MIHSISSAASTKLNRGTKSRFSFAATFSLGSSLYDIVESPGGFHNYKLSYLFSKTAITDYKGFVSNGVANVTEIKSSDAAKPLNKNSQITLKANISSGPDDMECENLQFICFLLESTKKASYNDTKMDNNVKCLQLDSIKECFPEIQVNITSFSKKYGPKIVRGYNASIQVSITTENIDSQHNIIPVASPRENFKFQLLFLNTQSKRRKRATTPTLGPFTIVTFQNRSSGLGTSKSKTFTGTVQFSIPRDKCKDLHFLCSTVAPGNGSSFKSSGSNPISCVNFDPLKNCAGKS